MSYFHALGPTQAPLGDAGSPAGRLRWWHLALFVAVVLGIPASLRWGDFVKFAFDESAQRSLEKLRPDCVFIGDSMLRSRIDAGRLNELANIRCDVLAYPGTGSAAWYLILENIVGALTPPPRCVIVFFRDRQLTLPALRTEGRYRNGLEVFMRGPDPRFEEILDAANRSHMRLFRRVLSTVYPVQKHRLEFQEDLQEKILKLAVAGEVSTARVHELLGGMFELKNLRHSGSHDDPAESDERIRMNGDDADFADAVTQSFLPMMLKSAESHRIQMVFYRVKCRPHRQLLVEPDRPGLRQYIRNLDDYLQSHGAILFDESQDPEITEGFYGEGDHVADQMMRPYTEIFWKRVRPFLAAYVRLSARARP